jgi:Tfp pilus assembly protein PilF
MLGCSPAVENGQAQSPERQSDAEYDLARDMFAKGQPRSALDHSLKAVEHNPDNARALFLTSAIYASFCNQDAGLRGPDCNIEKAESFARRAAKADERFREAKNLLGQVLIWEKKFDEAIAVIEPLTRDPAYVEAHLAWGNLGWAQVQGGLAAAQQDKVLRGIESLRNAVALQPKFCVGHFRLGAAHEARSEWALADQSYSQALEVDAPECKNLQDAWEARARSREKLGKLDDARADYAHCREIAPDTRIGKACVVGVARLEKNKQP